MSDLEVRLARCFSVVFPKLRNEDVPNANVASVDGWDSVATVSLLAVIEEEFGVEVEPEQPEDLLSFGSILDRLRSELQVF